MSSSIPTPDIDSLMHTVGARLNFSKQSGMPGFEYPLPFSAGRQNYTPANLKYDKNPSR